MKAYVVTPHKNCLNETVLMMGHNIHFNGEIWIIIPKLSRLPLLIWSTLLSCSLEVMHYTTNLGVTGLSPHSIFRMRLQTQVSGS